MYVDYQEDLFELSRRQDDMQGRFAPLFEKHRHEVFQAAVAAFPQAVNAAALRQKLAALALSIGVTFQFSHEGVEAICMLIAPQLTSLEIESSSCLHPRMMIASVPWWCSTNPSLGGVRHRQLAQTGQNPTPVRT